MFRAYERTDGQTDRQTHTTKLIVCLDNFANAPTNDVEAGRTDDNIIWRIHVAC